MARKQLSNQYRFSGKLIDQSKNEKRRIIKLLPSVHQTETLNKFFNSTVDHLFEPGKSKPINGYIGHDVAYSEESDNYYLKEQTSTRQFYQLEPAMVSESETGEHENLLFYEDLINKLRFQGSLVNNHNRLFEQPYYSWCPTYDLDKFINFREYYWLPEGAPIYEFMGHSADYLGDNITQMYGLTTRVPFPIVPTQIIVTVDGIQVPFDYDGVGSVTLTPAPAKNAQIKIYTAINVKDIIGTENFQVENGPTFTSGLKIKIVNDIDIEEIGKSYIIENVGDSIIFVPDNNPDLSLEDEYITIARGASDGNAWSAGNRWFHRTLTTTLGKEVLKEAQAKRPIIEFARNTQLFNFGSMRRPDVHLIAHDVSDFFGAVSGKLESSTRIDGVILNKEWIDEHGGQVLVLLTGDSLPELNNRVYRVRTNSVGEMLVNLVANGEDPSGQPEIGEIIGTKFGATYGNTDVHWNGDAWVIAQKKTSRNQAPLFKLYDNDGIELDDVGRYPESTFKGSRLFGFQIGDSLFDNELSQYVVHDNNGEFIFENYLITERFTYKVGVKTIDIPRNVSYAIKTNNDLMFYNDWHLVNHNSQQFVVDKFTANNNKKMYTLSQEPIDSNHIEVKKNSVVQKEGRDYIRQYNNILFVDLKNDDKIEARTFNPANKAINSTGNYEIPLNLQANPSWVSIETVSRGDLVSQFVEVMRKQVDFDGLEFSSNNWRDIRHDLSVGTKVLSHTSPLLLTMLLASSDDIDFIKAARYSELEYARFRSKFDIKIQDFLATGKYNDNDSITKWVDGALDELSRGMTLDFPFYLSDNGKTASRPDRNFIPATPSFLGAYPVVKPSVYTDSVTSESFIIGHDGSYFPLYGDKRDQAILELENRIYNSIPEYIKNKQDGFFDHDKLVSNKTYTGDYSHDEANIIFRPMFEKWCVNFAVDYKTNKNFDANDPFTWNWSSVRDYDNQPVPGNWRGIFKFHYGTDRPHTHPWEMLGFFTRPTWWNTRYGTTPYGSGNVIMWRDIQDGVIREGNRAGTHDRFKRPGLLNRLPVNQQGQLLDPYSAKLVRSQPTMINAQENWVWGDHSPAESAWMKSFWYPFAKVQASYLMKPAQLLETLWDSSRNLVENISVGFGFPYADQLVYGEYDELGNLYKPNGVQQWVYDFIRSKNKNVQTVLADKIRGLNTKLSYKVGGFTDSKNLFVVSDSIDRLPSEDISIELYNGPSIREEFIGGVIVQNIGSSWKIYGYDIIDPAFKVIPPDFNGGSVPVSLTSTRRNKIPSWHPSTYYSRNTTVRYNDSFYACIKSHTSGRLFESDFWQQVARPSFADDLSVQFYTTPNKAKTVERYAYGNVIRNAQEMSVFLSGYQFYLENSGWVFDKVINDDGDIANWRTCLKKFMAWIADENTKEGDIIVLMPDLDLIKFHTEHGNIEPIEQTVNGVYSILDKDGFPIQPYNTNVIREDGTVEITSRGTQKIYAVRIHVSEIEHVIVVNNRTIFGDLIYDPRFNARQDRLRLQGYKTVNWRGRIDAPGFIVSGNIIYPNFEKTADDFRRFFDVESVENTELTERTRANVGYSEKNYLSNLLITPTNQFEFYQGMIQQKGTPTALHRIFRNSFIRQNDSVKFLEEWGFRIGEFGGTEINKSTDFMIRQGDFKNDPQMYEFVGAGQGGWDLRLGWDDDHWDNLKLKEKISLNYSIKGIQKLSIVDAGEGYQSTPTISVNGPSNGFEAIASLNWSGSKLSNIRVVRGGSGFFEGDSVIINGSGLGATAVVGSVNYLASRIVEVKVEQTPGYAGAGWGYAVGASIIINGGNGRGRAVVTEVDNQGSILKVQLTEAGAGYDKNYWISFLGTNYSAMDYIKCRMSGGKLTAVTITNPGIGYDKDTYVTFSGGGFNALCEVEVTGAKLGVVEIKNAGGGFTTIPDVVVSGGGATQQATLLPIIQSSIPASPVNLATFKKPRGIVINKITVKITNAFNGIQPRLSIGDNSDVNRYVNSMGLTTIGSNTFEFGKEELTVNEQEEINVYVTNASESGNVTVYMDFEYTPSYYAEMFASIETTDNVVQIVDLFDSDTGKFVYKDDRWVWRHENRSPEWAFMDLESDRKGNLPSAGYVHLDDIDYTAKNMDEFLDLYNNEKEKNPATNISNSLTVKYIGDYIGTTVTPIVQNLSKGVYRVKNFNIDITEAFPLTVDNELELEITIGTIVEPTKYLSETIINTNTIMNYTHQTFEFIFPKLENDETINVFVTQKNGLSISPGVMTITANLELLGDIVFPGERAWCYDTGLGDWDVFRLGNTGSNVVETRPGSFEGQGTVVSTNKNMFEMLKIEHNWQEAPPETAPVINPTFKDDFVRFENRMDKVVLDGVASGVSDNILSGTYKTKISNTAKIFVDANQLQRMTTNSSIQIPIMDLIGSSGIVINKITASVVRPFLTPSNANPTVTIGTYADPDRFISAVNSSEGLRKVLPAPTRPTFTYGKPISVDVWDQQMTVLESDDQAKIRLIRSGNIFVTPALIKIINPGWGYSYDSNPTVTVLGPTGVKAVAKIEGTIVGYTVVDGGSGYTSAPTVNIYGGSGVGAQGIAKISNGKVTSVTIPGTGTGTSATVTVSGGEVTNIARSAGSGWMMNPIVTFEGGGSSNHAVVSTTLNATGGVDTINLDFNGSGYISSPTVTFHPWTGTGFTSKPTVVVGGGNGAGAIVEPIMMWRVVSVTITEWGKCSWLGDNGQVIIQAPQNGGGAIGELIISPETLEPTEIAQWRYRVISPDDDPNLNIWNYVNDPIEFPVPTSTNNPDYWYQEITLDLPDIDKLTIIEVDIPEFVIDETTGEPTSTTNITNGFLGNASTALVNITNDVVGSRDIDLKVAGTLPTFYINERAYEDDSLVAFYNSDGVTDGLLTLVVDYHYLTGFEIYEQDGEPAISSRTGLGGDIFAWNSVRFNNNDSIYSVRTEPVGGWIRDDKVFLDDGRSYEERSRQWDANTFYEYHELVKFNGEVYRTIKSGSGLVATVGIEENDIKSLQRPKITNFGTKYTHEPTVTFVGDGIDAEAKVLLAPTSIYKIKVKNPTTNFGYTGSEIIVIEPKNTAGRGGHAIIGNIQNGSIQDIILLDGGWNFDAAPNVYIKDDINSEKVELEAIMVPVPIKAVLMENRGRDYTTVEMVFSDERTPKGEFIKADWEKSFEQVRTWSTLHYTDVSGMLEWTDLRTQGPKINSDLIKGASIYNTDTQETIQTLQVYDPFKGYIPGSAKKELSHILEYDPAVYNVGPLVNKNSSDKVWNNTQVGSLWWDISTTRYLDYEIDSMEYRWNNWGKLAPGITVDVYEWVRSPVAPNLWNDYVITNRNTIYDKDAYKPTGTIKDDNNPSYVTKEEFNKKLNKFETVYYFWVKDAYSLPLVSDRSLTAVQVANIIQNPDASDIPWFAVLDSNKIIIGGSKQFVSNHNTSIKIDWKLNDSDLNYHKQWKLIREGDERNTIEPKLWDKMRDSLVGWDKSHRKINFTTRILENLNVSVTNLHVEDASNFTRAGGEFKIGDYWLSYEWIDGNTLMNISGVGNLVFQSGTVISQVRQKDEPKKVPDQWSSEKERYGILNGPVQTMFKVDTDQYGYIRPGRDARKAFVDTLNNILSREQILDTRYEWRQIFDREQALPFEHEYHFVVSSEFERDQLVETGRCKVGQVVLMEGIETTYGFWTLWQYDPTNSTENNGFVMVDAQRWRLQEGELWSAVDWYADGWGPSDYPVLRFATVADRDAARISDVTLLAGTLVKVDQRSPSDNRWSWSLYTDDGWSEVAREKSTIKLNDRFFNTKNPVYGYDSFIIDNIGIRDGSWELQFIVDELRTKLLTNLERNELFFSMIHTAVSQHDYTDWAFKTSFLYVAGYNEELKQTAIQHKDQMNNVLDYVDDIKPYHVKVRDFVRRLSTPIEIVNMIVTDFDKPLYWDNSLNAGNGGWRKLDPKNQDDIQILRSDKDLRHWFENYLKTNYSLVDWDDRWNPIRRPNVTIKFDRVSCKKISGWDQLEIPWDGSEERWLKDIHHKSLPQLMELYQTDPDGNYNYFIVDDSIGRDKIIRDNQNAINAGNQPILNTGDIVVQTIEKRHFMWSGSEWIEFWSIRWDDEAVGGAADRIDQFYEPTYQMKKKEMGSLISGCNYRGTVVEGGDMAHGLWDMFEWDHESGWSNEFYFYVGEDVSLNPTSTDWETGDQDSDIRLEGGEFVQPWFASNHPNELAQLKVRDPLMVTVYRTPTSGSDSDMPSTIPVTLRLFKDGFNNWESTFLQDRSITLAQDLISSSQEIVVMQPGGLTLHDPMSTDPVYLAYLRDKIKLSVGIQANIPITVDQFKATPLSNAFEMEEDLVGLNGSDDITALVEEKLNQLIARRITGVIWIGTERIEYSGIDYSESVSDRYKLINVTRGSKGTSRNLLAMSGTRVIDGSSLNSLQTYNNANLRFTSADEYSNVWKSWIKDASIDNIPGIQP